MSAVESRLNQYYEFDQDVTGRVSDAAERQNKYSFNELATQFGIGSGSLPAYPAGYKKPIEVLTILPKSDYDPNEATVYHTAFGYPVNKNTAMHAIRLFEADSARQMVVIGNPATVGAGMGKLSFKESLQVARYKDLRPAVHPLLAYLAQQQITQTQHLGPSYGADKAAVAIAESGRFDQEVSRGVLIEPVSATERSLKQLIADFGTSGGPQQDYVRQTGSMPYDEIWAEDSKIKFAAWAGGLARVSNIAIANVLTDGRFVDRASGALEAQEKLRLSIGWGSSSELVDDQTITTVTEGLRTQFGANRVNSLRIQGMHHAGVDDIDLHAAVMLQGLRD